MKQFALLLAALAACCLLYVPCHAVYQEQSKRYDPLLVNPQQKPQRKLQKNDMTFPPFVLITRSPTPAPIPEAPVAPPVVVPPPTPAPVAPPTPAPVPPPTAEPVPPPTPAPVPPPTAAPVAAPVPPPTLAPATASPTAPPVETPTSQAPTTKAPTRTPTSQAPTTSVPTTGPTLRPSVSPPPVAAPTAAPATPGPTRSPSAAPVTAVPTVSNTTTTDAPATASPTVMGDAVDVRIPNAQVIYPNVGQLSMPELRQVEELTEGWFDGFYNNSTIPDDDQRRLRSLVRTGRSGTGRNLQRGFVRNMVSSMAIEDQEVQNGLNTVTFMQQMTYVALPGASEPEAYLALPYRNTIAIGQLRRLLRDNMPAFADVGYVTLSPLAEAPGPAPTPNAPSPKDSGDDDGLSTGAIIGIAVGGAALLAAAVGGVFYYNTGKREIKPRKLEVGHPEADPYISGEMSVASKNKAAGGAGTQKEAAAANVAASKKTDDAASYAGKSVETEDFDYNMVGTAAAVAGAAAVGAAVVAADDSADEESASKSASAANYSDSDIQIEEDQFVVYAPAGKLGLVVDNPDDGAPVVHAIKEDSVLADQVQVGDRLVGVDEVDVRSLSPVKVSKLISKRSTNPLRKLTLTRAKPEDSSAAGLITNASSQAESESLVEASTEDGTGDEVSAGDSSHVGSMSRLSGMDDPLDADDSVEFPDDGSSQVDAMSTELGAEDSIQVEAGSGDDEGKTKQQDP